MIEPLPGGSLAGKLSSISSSSFSSWCARSSPGAVSADIPAGYYSVRSNCRMAAVSMEQSFADLNRAARPWSGLG